MNNVSASYCKGVFAILFVFMLAGVHGGAYAQVDSLRADSVRADTLSQRQPPQTLPAQQSQQEGQVDFQATDSLIFNFEKDRVATLYGSSRVTHQAGDLTAGKIALNLDRHIVSASTQTPQDTLSQPVLTRQNDRIRSNSISFNYQSEKGRFEVARVQMQQGNLIGEKVKNTGPNVVFIENGIYSTCTLDHPHYYLKADRMKVVNEEEVFFTNARLYILDIPYPLIFPFGYVPARIDRRQSGLLEPTYVYQESSTRGLGLQNFGWFQYFNDYLVGQASVDIFTSGTFFLDASSNYNIQGKLSGRVQIGYSRERGLESTDPSFSINTQKRIGISHNQTISPYANFSTNINLRTADFYRRNSYNIGERAETSTSSNLNYRYRHPGNLYNFSISAQQNQNFQTNRVQLSGPNMNFSLKQISPFSSDERNAAQGPAPFYESISIRYQNEFESDYEFQPLLGDTARINWFEALLDPGKYREATGNSDHYRYGFRQQAGVSFGNLLPSRFINMSANLDYNEYWFPTTIRKTFNADSNRVETGQVRGFAAARDFNTGINLSTTFYGIWNQNIGNFDAFRHTIRPSVSLSYRPDFSSDYWGYYREVQTDTLGNTQIYSIFEDEVFSGPGRGEQRALSLSLNNVFEAKQVSRDSTGEKKERIIRLIDQLNFQTSYNFAADSLKLSDLSANFSTSIVENINIRASARFNFYERDSLGRKIDRFLWQGGDRFLEPLNWSVSASTSYSWGGGRGLQVSDTPHYPQYYDPLNQAVFHGFDPRFNDRPVQPLDSPFGFSLNFSYRWNLNPGPDRENSKSATINASNISFRLTPKWEFRTQLGYDFIEKELTPSRFSLTRNLHCWNLSFEMNPFGEFQYFFFRLSVNSGQISGLLQKLPGLNNLERSSSPTGRGNPRF